MSDDHEIFTSIVDWFGEIESHIPGAGTWVGEILLGPIPKSSANQVYDLADDWGRLAVALGDAFEEVMNAADPILQSWSGDAAANQFVEQWYAYLEGLRATAESAGALQQGVQSFGLEVELMKFMAALNLIMLAVSLIMLIIAIIPTGGGSLAAAPGLFTATRIAIGQAASKTVGRVSTIAIQAALKNIAPLFSRFAVPAAVRAAVPAAVRTTLPRLVGIGLTRVVPAAIRAPLANLARTVAARGISRAVANRLAAQALRTQAGHQLRSALARQSVRAVQNQLAREIEKQLVRKFANKAAVEAAEEASERVLQRFAAEQVAKVTFGRELAGFVGTRVALGAGFMGGGNLTGQLAQIWSGNRDAANLLWGQVLRGTLEGAAFGAGMFGGPLGHAIGGATAGTVVGVGQETLEYFTADDAATRAFDWNRVGHSAVMGAGMGVIAGGQTHLETARFGGGKLRIGEDIRVLPGDHGGVTISASGGRHNEGVLLTDGGEVAYQTGAGHREGADGFAGRPDLARQMDTHWPSRGAETDTAPAAAGGPGGGGAPVDRSGADAPARPSSDGGPPTRDNPPTDRTVGDGSAAGHAPGRAVDGAPDTRAAADAAAAGRAGGDTVPAQRDPGDAGGNRFPADRADSPADRARDGDRSPDAMPPTARPDVPTARTDMDAAPGRSPDPRPGDRGDGPADRSGLRERDDGPAVRDRGGDGPPPDGPLPRDPDGDSVTRHEGEEPVLRSAGAEPGEAPTPRSIEHGTVRMEDHPNFANVVTELEGHGFRLRFVEGDPHVVVRHVYDDMSRPPIRVEREVDVPRGMRYLDLEHELGHVRQLMDQNRFPDGPPGSEALRRHSDGQYRRVGEDKLPPGFLTSKNDIVMEFHVRLEEYIRLHERGVDQPILDAHARGVEEYARDYDKKIMRSPNRPPAVFARERFGDIPELRQRFEDLRASTDRPAGRTPDNLADRGGRGTDGDARPLSKSAGGRPEDTPADRSHANGSGDRASVEQLRSAPRGDAAVPLRSPDDAAAARPDGGDASTGASIRPRDHARSWDWAERAYDRFRADNYDVTEIAGNLADTPRLDGGVGYTEADIMAVKQHVMFDEHPLGFDGEIEMRRFDAGPDTAEAWIRLREGRPLPEDLVMLHHELAEAAYMRAHPDATYIEAHRHTNQLYNWEAVLPGRTGEDLDIRWGRADADGNFDHLQADPGRRATGGVHLRSRRDEPPVSDRQGDPVGESAGRNGGQHLRGGAVEDPAVPSGADRLASDGDVRGVALVPVDGPAPLHPVEAATEVAAVVDAEVAGLLGGHEPVRDGRPYRADWDPDAGTLRVHYPDGVSVDVVVQVNVTLPPGHSIVVRPPLAVLDGGGWHQVQPAGVILSPHVPGDPAARGLFVREALGDAWQSLHDQVGDALRPRGDAARPVDGGPPRDATPGDGLAARDGLVADAQLMNQNRFPEGPPGSEALRRQSDGQYCRVGDDKLRQRFENLRASTGRPVTRTPDDPGGRAGRDTDGSSPPPRESGWAGRHGESPWQDTGGRSSASAGDDVPAERPEESTADASTGASIRPRDDVRAFDWAERAYDRFRADDGDVADIARNLADTPRLDGGTGYSQADIAQVKRHLMEDPQPLDGRHGAVVMRRFDADPDIAEAWIRLREGRPLPEDLVLLHHELTESGYLRTHPGATYREAHAVANERYSWDDVTPERTGEDLDNRWGRDQSHGDPARLREDPRGRTTGGVHLRVPGDGPPVGDREGFPARQSGGTHDLGQGLRGGALEDFAAAPGAERLAGERDVRGVALVPVDGPAPLHPVEAATEVAAVVDAEVAGLLGGHEPVRDGRPYRADWDPDAGTLRVHYPDGVSVDVVVQVNVTLPPGHSIVVRPPLAVLDGGGWHQVQPAGVILSPHVPGDPAARGLFVREALGDAWQSLHDQVGDALRPRGDAARPVDGGPPRDATPGDGLAARDGLAAGALRALEEPVRPDVPVLDADRVVRHEVAPADPPAPPPLTPDTVRQTLTGRGVPEQVVRWTGDHLAVRADDGGLRPRSLEEIDATVRGLADEALGRVTPRPEPELPAGDRHTASPIPGTEFVPDGRPAYHPDLTVAELHRATGGVLPEDFTDGGVRSITTDGPLVQVERADGRMHVFEPRVGERMPDLAETVVRAGTPESPHVVRVNSRVAVDQLPRVWVHEITETLAHQQAAATRERPHGVIQRARAALARAFGRTPDEVAPARPDPHAAARMNERRHLERLHDWAEGRPDEQVRLRREIDGVDRDLLRLDHLPEQPRPAGMPLFGRAPDAGSVIRDGVLHGPPPREVAPVHDAAPPRDEAPAHAQEPPPRAESSHDGHWTDPPWQREGRRPSLDELIPLTEAETVRWADSVQREIVGQLDGRTFGGMRAHFDLTDRYAVHVNPNSVRVRLEISHPQNGYVGHTVRVFQREPDGTLSVTHNSLVLSEHAQGRGFAREWNSFLTDWYRYSGVSHIEVHASMSVGGYAWASDGYDWAPNTEHRSNAVLGRLRDGMARIDDHAEQLRRWNEGDGSVDMGALLRRYGVEHPDELPVRMAFERVAGQDILDRAAANAFGSPGYPTPVEIADAGSADRHGRSEMWLGKEALLGADWKGVKVVTDGVVRHPRADGPPITAARMGDSDFHGSVREHADPAAVRAAAEAALSAALGAGPRLGHGLRVDVGIVRPELLPDGAVARSVPFDALHRDLPDGITPPEGGGYRIEISARASDLAVPRAVSHEIAELQATLQRAEDGLDLTPPDLLRPGEPPASRALSPHDLGRLAEIDHLWRLGEDPAHAEYSRVELDALRDHLGLGRDVPGGPERRSVVDEHLRALGHDPSALWGSSGPAESAARATELAVAARSADGLVDGIALARFVEEVPALGVSGRGGVEGALEAFAAQATGNEEARLQNVGGGAGRGQSGAPVYLVHDESGRLIAVAKIFPEAEELVRELSALNRLGADEFRTFGTPRVEGAAVLPLPDGTAGALVMSVAPGRSLFDLIGDVRTAVDRPAAMADLHQAVRAAATALAELHSRPAGAGGPVDRGFLLFNHGLAQREAAMVAGYTEQLERFGIVPAELRGRVDEIVLGGLGDPGGAAIMHGDAHPGNVFWDPGHGITLIDAPHSHFSMDDEGRPIGTPARDVANMLERLAHFGYEARLSSTEVEGLRTSFRDTYAREGGPEIPAAALRAFTARFALRDVLDTLTSLQQLNESRQPDRPQRRSLMAQLATEIGLLKGVLGWDRERS